MLMTDRVLERRRAVALARHFARPGGPVDRADRRSAGALTGDDKAYFYDPTGAKAREVKARYRGVCRGCGAPTSARNGKGDAYEYCKRCHPGAIAREWTRERVREAMRAWRARYGSPPTSYDWSRSHAGRRGPDWAPRTAAGRRMAAGEHGERGLRRLAGGRRRRVRRRLNAWASIVIDTPTRACG